VDFKFLATRKSQKILATRKFWQQKILKKFWLYRDLKRCFWQQFGGEIIALNPQKIPISQIFAIKAHLSLYLFNIFGLCAFPVLKGD